MLNSIQPQVNAGAGEFGDRPASANNKITIWEGAFMLPDKTTNNSAPCDSDDKFCVMLELTKEEKQELLKWWFNRI